jgi:class 3 adenylate cyclase
VPHVAEDDAMRAVRAGTDMQREFRSLAREHADIDLRVAINTGEVVVSADNTDVVGDPVNVAAHLAAQAAVGEILVTEEAAAAAGLDLRLAAAARTWLADAAAAGWGERDYSAMLERILEGRAP